MPIPTQAHSVIKHLSDRREMSQHMFIMIRISLQLHKTGVITYDPANGNYSGSVDFGNSIPDGYYTVLLKEDTHLRKSVPGIIHMIPQQNNTMPTVTLVAGDINNDNVINILDYNILIGCYSDFFRLFPVMSKQIDIRFE